MKKLIVSGIITLISIMALAALSYGQPSGPASGHTRPGAHDKDCPGMGPGKMEGCCLGGQGMKGGQGMGPGMMAGHGPGGRMMEAEHHLSMLFDGLALDEQQKKVIGEIKSTIKKDTIRRMADISIARIELKDLLLQDPLDMKAVEAKVRQLGLLRTEMHLAHIKALEMIKAKLTPEQRKKITERMKTGPMMMMPE
jgi:Spy/CpxP family protein refolding chaperone